MKHQAFEAFCAAMEGQDTVQVRRAQAFWSRLGDSESMDVALDAVSMAKVLELNSAGVCMSEAREAGYSEESIIDAALYAARS